MPFRLSRNRLASAAASLIGVACVVSAVQLQMEGKTADALMRAGLGLNFCGWAFTPLDEFLRVARMKVTLEEGARRAYIKLVPRRLMPLMWLSMVMIIAGFVMHVMSALRA